MRCVSRRPDGQDPIADAAILQRTMNRLRGAALIPRGLYRFRNHEEADEWMIRMIAATHARPSSKTFSREYGRFFGSAPTKDINRLREEGLRAGEALH